MSKDSGIAGFTRSLRLLIERTSDSDSLLRPPDVSERAREEACATTRLSGLSRLDFRAGFVWTYNKFVLIYHLYGRRGQQQRGRIGITQDAVTNGSCHLTGRNGGPWRTATAATLDPCRRSEVSETGWPAHQRSNNIWYGPHSDCSWYSPSQRIVTRPRARTSIQTPLTRLEFNHEADASYPERRVPGGLALDSLEVESVLGDPEPGFERGVHRAAAAGSRERRRPPSSRTDPNS